MKWSDEDIDQLFRDAGDQINIPFQEEYWNEVEQMLPKKNKKYRGFFYIMSSLICAGLLFGCILLITGRSKSMAGEKAISDMSDIYNTTATETIQATNTITESTSLQEAYPVTSTIQTLYTEQNQEIHPSASKKQIETPETEISSPVSYFESFRRLQEQTAKNRIINRTESGTSFPDRTTSTDDILFPFLSTLPVRSVSSTNEQLPGTPDTYTNENISGKNFIPARKKVLNWSVYAGLGVSQNYLADQSKNIMPVFNIGVTSRFMPDRIGVSFGITISNAFARDLQTQKTSRVYGYSVTEYRQDFTYRQLTFIEVPVLIEFRHKNHFFSAGVSGTYLAASWMKFQEYRNNIETSNDNYFGLNYGLRRFGIKPVIAYEYLLKGNWAVGAQFSTQVIQQLDTRKFNEVNTTRLPLSVAVTLRKNL